MEWKKTERIQSSLRPFQVFRRSRTHSQFVFRVLPQTLFLSRGCAASPLPYEGEGRWFSEPLGGRTTTSPRSPPTPGVANAVFVPRTSEISVISHTSAPGNSEEIHSEPRTERRVQDRRGTTTHPKRHDGSSNQLISCCFLSSSMRVRRISV